VQEYTPGNENVFTSRVYTNQAISGVALRANWVDVEPSFNRCNWRLIDNVFAAAQSSKKFVVLILVPGFGTPTWTEQPATSPGETSGTVKTAVFNRQYAQGAGTPGTLPVPWDPTYLARWFAFLQDVADRYGNRADFLMISADGPTSVSAEMTLPGRIKDSALPGDGSDIKQWESLGYTPELYEGAWKTVFSEYAKIFPHQYVSFALGSGLPIGNSGKRAKSESLDTTNTVLAEGQQYGPKLAIQESALTAKGDFAGIYDIVKESRGKFVTGYQDGTNATHNAGYMGDTGNPLGALTRTLHRGLAGHPTFLQVYETDVNNPMMQSLLHATACQLVPCRASR